MLQLNGIRSRLRENGAHKVRHYRKINVASGPVPDVLETIPSIVPIARINNKSICLRQFTYGESPLSSPLSKGFL